MRKRSLLIALVLIVIVGVGIVGFALWPTRTRTIAATPDADAALIEAGRYIAVAADCAACHDALGGTPFAGGLPLKTPIGTVYGANITPDSETGIGRYTLNDFDRAVRHGIGRDDATLYPAMPYPAYAKLTDADVIALYAYFMHGVAPVVQQSRPAGIPFPLSMRWPLAIWRKVFVPAADGPFDASRYADPVIARGAYLVQGPGHCGACHTPRAWTLEEQGLDERAPTYLAGGQVIDGWAAPNLRSNEGDGLDSWSASDVAEVLETGRSIRHAVFGAPMSDVILRSTQHLKPDDLRAIALYLKTLPPATGSVGTFAADDAMARALAAGEESGPAARLYIDNCAACHLTNGKGPNGAFPAIAGNSIVLGADPTSLIHIVLTGAKIPPTRERPSALGMPGFGWRLSDEQVAQLLTFVRKSWGNNAPAVDASHVAALRSTLKEQTAEVTTK
jgi:alcohol dehydrogenase (quinone), cytochrome c subunit